MLECVVNISEGRDPRRIAEVGAAAGRLLLDLHSDPDHHRSVLTLAGPEQALLEGVQQVAAAAVARLDLTSHRGVHPRIGVLDVVPFVALRSSRTAGRLRLSEGPLDQAVEARNGFGAWAAAALELPSFLYGPERSLPDLRRRAWSDLRPDFGPPAPHPTAGAVALGARPVLVAYNLWLTPGASLAVARQAATRVRGPGLRALGLAVGGGERVQVSVNLTEPWRLGPGAVHDAVAQALRDLGDVRDLGDSGDLGDVRDLRAARGAPAGIDPAGIDRAELVGLLPAAVLAAEPRHRWRELGLGPEATIEARLERAGLDGGSL